MLTTSFVFFQATDRPLMPPLKYSPSRGGDSGSLSARLPPRTTPPPAPAWIDPLPGDGIGGLARISRPLNEWTTNTSPSSASHPLLLNPSSAKLSTNNLSVHPSWARRPRNLSESSSNQCSDSPLPSGDGSSKNSEKLTLLGKRRSFANNGAVGKEGAVINEKGLLRLNSNFYKFKFSLISSKILPVLNFFIGFMRVVINFLFEISMLF